jgi:hypothetical protein
MAVLVLLMIPVATYRDIFSAHDRSMFFLLFRAGLFTAVSLGLWRKNIWAVRICYAFGSFMLFVFIVGVVWLDFKSTFEIVQMWPQLLMFGLLALTYFVPAAELTGRTRQELPTPVEDVEPDSGNPYEAPRADSR